MKKIFILSTILFVSVSLLSGCSLNSNNLETNNGKLKVAATIFPLYDLTRQVGGDKVDAKLILPGGASPHTFEITPSLVKDLQDTDLIFTIGHSIDNWASDLINHNNAELVVVDQGIVLQPFKEQEDEHEHEDEHEDGHDHGDIDPHYWLSPDNAIIIAQNISEKLINADKKNEDYYKNNLNDFVRNIESKEREWKVQIDALPSKNLVVFHDAWNYFADYFGLDIVASFEPFPGKEPSPEYLIDIQEDVKDSDIRAMFIEPQLSRTSLETLAKDMNVKLGIMDPLGGVSGRETYIDLIDYNINSLSENLH